MSKGKNYNSVSLFLNSTFANLVLKHQAPQNTAKIEGSRGTVSFGKKEHGGNTCQAYPLAGEIRK